MTSALLDLLTSGGVIVSVDEIKLRTEVALQD